MEKRRELKKRNDNLRTGANGEDEKERERCEIKVEDRVRRKEVRREKCGRESGWNVTTGRKKLGSEEIEKGSSGKLNLGRSGGPSEEKMKRIKE